MHSFLSYQIISINNRKCNMKLIFSISENDVLEVVGGLDIIISVSQDWLKFPCLSLLSVNMFPVLSWNYFRIISPCHRFLRVNFNFRWPYYEKWKCDRKLQIFKLQSWVVFPPKQTQPLSFPSRRDGSFRWNWIKYWYFSCQFIPI